jgi:hypothetical protein
VVLTTDGNPHPSTLFLPKTEIKTALSQAAMKEETFVVVLVNENENDLSDQHEHIARSE